MAKLYPPKIERTIPAFTGNTLTVPFEYNPAVSPDEVSGMALLIKNVQTNTWVDTKPSSASDIKDGKAVFTLGYSFNIGQYYKIQIAFINSEGQIGYYSEASIVKYTSQPTLLIERNENGVFEGTYTNSDITERVYEYWYTISKTDQVKQEIVYQTNAILHNSSSDSVQIIDKNKKIVSTDLLEIPMDLECGNYQITYGIKTNNGLVAVDDVTPLSMTEAEKFTDNTSIDVKNDIHDKENGCIEIKVYTDGNKKQFSLLRSDGQIWHEIYTFDLNVSDIWKDCTVEQGKTYSYKLRLKSPDGVYETETKTCKADFEHCFLTDSSNKQLCIKFNPKISSWKINTLEQKMDTLGGKYPFFFRNGNVSYAEFPLSGLISYLMDEYGTFNKEFAVADSKRRETQSNDTFTEGNRTSLTSNNIYDERKFKTEVLNWLNDGKPQLFRSATEGNFVVRLMNVSLSPNDTLGRMLHTVSATAYECGDYDYTTLKELGFFNTSNFVETTYQLLSDKDGKLLMDKNNIQLAISKG